MDHSGLTIALVLDTSLSNCPIVQLTTSLDTMKKALVQVGTAILVNSTF